MVTVNCFYYGNTPNAASSNFKKIKYYRARNTPLRANYPYSNKSGANAQPPVIVPIPMVQNKVDNAKLFYLNNQRVLYAAFNAQFAKLVETGFPFDKTQKMRLVYFTPLELEWRSVSGSVAFSYWKTSKLGRNEPLSSRWPKIFNELTGFPDSYADLTLDGKKYQNFVFAYNKLVRQFAYAQWMLNNRAR